MMNPSFMNNGHQLNSERKYALDWKQSFIQVRSYKEVLIIVTTG